jgi:hypothetical protein
MNDNQEYRIYPSIRNFEDLGRHYLGSEHQNIVPTKQRIDRAEYGRKLADAEGGQFTLRGYIVPIARRA